MLDSASNFFFFYKAPVSHIHWSQETYLFKKKKIKRPKKFKIKGGDGSNFCLVQIPIKVFQKDTGI